jgi:hypothetical protein
MKKTILFITLSLSVLIGYGQYGEGNPETAEQWKSKTLVIIDYPNGEIYNEAVKIVAKKRWYNDKIEHVKYADRKVLAKRKDIVVLSIKQWLDYSIPVICFTTRMNGLFDYTFSFKNDGWAYNYIQAENKSNWTIWRKNWEKNRSANRKILQSRTITEGLKIINESTSERTKLTIETLFNTTDNFSKGDYIYKNAKKDNGIYNTDSNKKLIKSKTLLIEEKSLLKTLTLAKIKAKYKGAVQIVTEDELAKFIKSKDANMMYLHTKEEGSFPTYAIIDIADRKIIYCGQERTKPGDSKPAKIFERMMLEISNSIF